MSTDQPPTVEGTHRTDAPLASDGSPQTTADFDNYFDVARTELLELLGGFAPTSVLDVGCGAGANLVSTKQRHPGCRASGIERDPRAAAIAAAHPAIDGVLSGDVLSGEIEFPPDSFDLVIMSHVLEHFEDPALVLHKVLGWTRPHARLLVALPNLRHYSVVWDLLVRGDFRYRSHGILDQTHLRFFTRRSAVRFLQAQGLEVERCRPEVAGRLSRLISGATFHLADEFAGYAYNFCLRKAGACAS